MNFILYHRCFGTVLARAAGAVGRGSPPGFAAAMLAIPIRRPDWICLGRVAVGLPGRPGIGPGGDRMAEATASDAEAERFRNFME